MTKAGQVVWHPKFGIGVLMEDIEDGQDSVIVNYRMGDDEWDLITSVSEIVLGVNKSQDE